MLRMTLCLMLLLGFGNAAFAMRCGNLLVHEGDHMLDVLDKCGDPDYRDQRTVVRGQQLRHPYGALLEGRYEEIDVEEWVYNFGPHRFKQYLRFENGILIETRNLQRGN